MAYDGEHHAGLAIQQGQVTPLATVEACLLDALATCRLIVTRDLEALEFSRCGRTDRGVSAAGQVIALNVRSNGGGDDATELPYLAMLNRSLPRTIHVLAWSPVDLTFDARFSCTARHYKYFFRADGLNVTAMRAAAALLEGEHDFRNFCKLDPSKQMTSFVRRIDSASIGRMYPLDDDYVFDLVGSAFLYHQVRHIVAVLFHVGAGLEPPSVVSALLDVERLPSKPNYEMAEALPLMLWRCGYPDGTFAWRGDGGGARARGSASARVHEQMDAAKVRVRLLQHMLESVPSSHVGGATGSPPTTVTLPKGAGVVKMQSIARYRPIPSRPCGEHFSVANARWQATTGARRAAKAAQADADAEP